MNLKQGSDGMRLIDVDELFQKLKQLGICPLVVERTIENMPTVDAEPIRKGKWIKTDWRAKCSECGETGSIFDTPINPFKYCPNCGAKMRER